MTATDELRRLLDGRGVEWWNETDPIPQTVTMARVGEQLIEYHENVNGSAGYHVFNVHDLTPEQAIEATLGSGTCEMEYVPDWMGWHCKSCDHLRQGLRDQKPRYCPNCGRAVDA